MPRRIGLPVLLPVAVGQPVLLVGAAFAAASLGTHAPDGGPPGLAAALWVAIGALWLSSLALTPFGPGLGVGAVASLIALGTVVHAVPAAALHERGVGATCTVLDVETRTTTSSHYVSSGSGGGYWTSETKTRYVHTLRCGSPVAADPVRMVRSSRAAAPGERLAVVLDPLGRVGAVPATSAGNGSALGWTSLAAVVVAVLARVGGVLRAYRRSWVRRGEPWYDPFWGE